MSFFRIIAPSNSGLAHASRHTCKCPPCLSCTARRWRNEPMPAPSYYSVAQWVRVTSIRWKECPPCSRPGSASCCLETIEKKSRVLPVVDRKKQGKRRRPMRKLQRKIRRNATEMQKKCRRNAEVMYQRMPCWNERSIEESNWPVLDCPNRMIHAEERTPVAD